MSAAQPITYDVVIVGAGVAGALIAKQLGQAGKKVLILEAGAGLPPNINAFMERFYNSAIKVPESPYTPDLFEPSGSGNFGDLVNPSTLNAARASVLMTGAGSWRDPNKSYLIQQGKMPFSSSYERVAGGTMRHWLGTSLRFVPNDFRMKDAYDQLINWPINYEDLSPWYGKAEHEIGVSADTAEQSYLGITFPPDYSYPMPAIPPTLVDDAVRAAVEGMEVDGTALTVSGTPAGRNSRPYQGRRACAGNTNCIPICPIQAKYDPSVSLNQALDTGNVTLMAQTVASEVIVGDDDRIAQINYLQYADPSGPQTGSGSVRAKVFVLAAHAIETPRLLLMSTNQGRFPNGVANHSGQVGKNLMDHPLYLAWALMPEDKPVFPFRGPLATSGIESLRDGAFRSKRAAFRIEIGNEGWNFSNGDPDTTTLDFINGTNKSLLNPPSAPGSPAPTGKPQALFGKQLVAALNGAFTRQFRLGFLVEQSPEERNSVTLSEVRDHLGLPRPQINYDLSDYTKNGFVAAKKTADAIFKKMNATQYTHAQEPPDPSEFEIEVDGKPTKVRFYGSGHIVGTYRMGSDRDCSVVNAEQRSWDHPNLFLVGSGVFPTVATGNPTLTIAALSLWAADTILKTDLA